MLQLGGREALRVDVGDLLQLQRSLERRRISGVPADEEEVSSFQVPRGQLADLRLEVQRLLHLFRQRPQEVHVLRDLGRVHGPPDLGQIERQDVQGHHLRREGLGRGHADLRPRPGVEDTVGLPSDGGTDRIGDADDV